MERRGVGPAAPLWTPRPCGVGRGAGALRLMAAFAVGCVLILAAAGVLDRRRRAVEFTVSRGPYGATSSRIGTHPPPHPGATPRSRPLRAAPPSDRMRPPAAYFSPETPISFLRPTWPPSPPSPGALVTVLAALLFLFGPAAVRLPRRAPRPAPLSWVVAHTREGESVHVADGRPPEAMTVAAFYKFVLLADHMDLRPRLQEFCDTRRLFGTILLAKEGINATVAGTEEAVAGLLDHLRADPRLSDLEAKYSIADNRPFRKMKVRTKKEIVTMGVEDVDPGQGAVPVDPKDWNDLMRDPEAVVIDVRNAYECRIGAFENAIDPGTDTFREFPEYVDSIPEAKQKKVLMYCTGGIRCEKAGAYMRQRGFEEVYSLKGGVLKYLEEVPEAESLWKGQCFVFDRRVAVKHGLAQGDYSMCFACGEPMDEGDEQSPLYESGVSCPRCHDRFSEEDKERFRERIRQMHLAKSRLDRGEDPGSPTAFSSKLWSVLPTPP